MESLQGAIDDAYAVFGEYQRPLTFVGCACCWSGESIADDGLFGQRGMVRVAAPGGDVAVREVPASDLIELETSILLTGGDSSVYKHYLPRLLDLAAHAQWPDWPDLGSVLGRLAYRTERIQPWWQWPERERRAIRNFFDKLWDTCLARVPRRHGDVDETLAALARAVPDLTSYLVTWQQFASTTAIDHLEDFLVHNLADLIDNTMDLWGSTTDDITAANRDRVIAWLHSPELAHRISDVAPQLVALLPSPDTGNRPPTN